MHNTWCDYMIRIILNFKLSYSQKLMDTSDNYNHCTNTSRNCFCISIALFCLLSARLLVFRLLSSFYLAAHRNRAFDKLQSMIMDRIRPIKLWYNLETTFYALCTTLISLSMIIDSKIALLSVNKFFLITDWWYMIRGWS